MSMMPSKSLRAFQEPEVGLKRERVLANLLHKASALEAKCIIRIALGSMRLGVGEMTVLDAFALAFTEGSERECWSDI